ncbi:hypothetical protein GGI42DRAFT_306591 [Trichoderma sp. SZMC 28013]
MALLHRSGTSLPALWRSRPATPIVGAVASTHTCTYSQPPSRLRHYSGSSNVTSSRVRSLIDKRAIPSTAIVSSNNRHASTAAMEKPDYQNMYTASSAFFEALWEAGVTHCFVNLGSDHPSIIEAMVKGARERKGNFPKMITCPNEVCLYFYRSLLSCRISHMTLHELLHMSTDAY